MGMDRAEKTRQLELLRAEIKATIPNPWLFPTQDRVMGFVGTGPVMFIGERPSTGNFGGPADDLSSINLIIKNFALSLFPK